MAVSVAGSLAPRLFLPPSESNDLGSQICSKIEEIDKLGSSSLPDRSEKAQTLVKEIVEWIKADPSQVTEEAVGGVFRCLHQKLEHKAGFFCSFPATVFQILNALLEKLPSLSHEGLEKIRNIQDALIQLGPQQVFSRGKLDGSSEVWENGGFFGVLLTLHLLKASIGPYSFCTFPTVLGISALGAALVSKNMPSSSRANLAGLGAAVLTFPGAACSLVETVQAASLGSLVAIAGRIPVVQKSVAAIFEFMGRTVSSHVQRTRDVVSHGLSACGLAWNQAASQVRQFGVHSATQINQAFDGIAGRLS